MASSLEQFLHESPYAPVIFGLLFIAIWALISFLISRGGWHAFASRYRSRNRPGGGAWGSPFTSFGLLRSHYAYCIRVVFCDTGVYFSTSLLVRAFHAPFMVPWASVSRVEKKTGLLPRYRLDIEDAAGEIHVTLPAKAEHELLKYKQAA
jgi:hypothetical protein